MQYVLKRPQTTSNSPIYITNKTINIQNEYVCQHISGQEYVFNAKDHHHDACPLHFKLQNLNHTIGLHCQICLKLGMFVELCVGNCATHDGLFNGANGIFKFVT